MSAKYRKNHLKAWAYFVWTGALPADAKKNEWCLHHVDPNLKYTDPERYEEWRIEDLKPMLKSEHTRMHQLGSHWSEGSKAKFSAKLKGHEVSAETRAKISAACKGKPSWLKGTHGLSWITGKHHTEETKAKISSALKGRPGRVQSKEERAKRAESVKTAWQNEQLRENQSKHVSSLVWINDGKANTRIPRGSELPEGWSLGRLKGFKWKKRHAKSKSSN